MTRQSARREGLRTYFFMTWRLTLVMSTFWLNSRGNLVLFSSFASTPVAMIAVVSVVRSHLVWRVPLEFEVRF